MDDQRLSNVSRDDSSTSNLSQSFSSMLSTVILQSEQNNEKFDEYRIQQNEILRIIIEQLTKNKNQILNLTKLNQELQLEIEKQNVRIKNAEETNRRIQEGMKIRDILPDPYVTERKPKQDENTTVVQTPSPYAPRYSEIGLTIIHNNIFGLNRVELVGPSSIAIDENQTIYISDTGNHRIVAYDQGTSHCRTVFGFSGAGNKMSQLRSPLGLFYDKQDCSLIICDHGNCRIVQWSPSRNTIHAKKLIENVKCVSVAMDSNQNLYVTENQYHQVRKYYRGDFSQSKIVAGGQGAGNGLNRLNSPQSIFITEQNVLYIADSKNNRIMKWMPDATEGQIVVGSDQTDTDQTDICQPYGLIVDADENIYVTEWGGHCVSRWREGQKMGEIVVGQHGRGSEPNQLNYPTASIFDRHSNLYVVDHLNNRVQIFMLENED